MRQVIWKHKRWFGYSLYCILITMVFLYYRFPSDALRDYLEATLVKINPQMHLSIGKVSPAWPFSMKLMEPRLSVKESPGTVLFRAERLMIRPHIWSFIQGKSTYGFKCLAYGGNLEGRIHFLKNRWGTPFTTSMTLKNIRIDNTFLPNMIDRRLAGILGGTIEYEGKDKFLRDGTGEANLKLSHGRIDLSQPLLGLESVDLKELLIKMVLKKKTIDLSNVELKGESMHGTVSGFVRLREEFLKSGLDLRGTIEPFADLLKKLERYGNRIQFFKKHLKKGKLSFIIRGTIGGPKIQFI